MSDATAGPPVDGSTAPLLRRLGRRYAAFARCGVGVASALVAPWTVPPAPGVTAAVAFLFVVWSVAYAARLLRGPAPAWWSGVDVAIVAGLCLAVPWLDSPRLLGENSGWVIGVAAITVMSVQWHLHPLGAWCAAFAIAGCFLTGAGTSAGVAPADTLKPALWLLAEAGLSMLVWALVNRGGRAADVLMARQLEAHRAADLEAALRADQRAHWAAVHDTAATTLLMVGSGEVRGDERWLGGQLERDIAALDGAAPDDERVDIGTRNLGPTKSVRSSQVWLPDP